MIARFRSQSAPDLTSQRQSSSMILRLFFLFILLVGANLLAAGGEVNRPGLLGTDLSDARVNSDYFQFFNLSPATDTQSSDDAQAFKPGGDFRKLVTVYVRTNAQQKITGIRTVIARSFIDDPTNGIFARDFVSSTLRSAVNSTDAASLENIATEIHYRDTKRIFLHGSEPHLSSSPSAAYQVFSGAGSSWEIKLPSGKIRLSNETAENRQSLIITVEAH